MIYSLVVSLLLTLIVETSFAYLFRVRKIDLLIVVLVNIATNPVLVTIENLIWLINDKVLMIILSLILWVVLEVLVVWIEGFAYKKLSLKSQFSPFKLSLYLNCISIVIGILFNVLFAFLA